MPEPTEKDRQRAKLDAEFVFGGISVSMNEEDDDLIVEALARARADERERAAKVAEAEGHKHRLNDDHCRMDACFWTARAIRGQGDE